MNKKSDLGNLYRKLYETYSAAYADKKKQIVQEEVNNLWKSLKSSDDVEGKVESKIKELQIKMTRKKATLMNFFSKIPSSSTSQIQLESEGVKVSLNFVITTKLNWLGIADVCIVDVCIQGENDKWLHSIIV